MRTQNRLSIGVVWLRLVAVTAAVVGCSSSSKGSADANTPCTGITCGGNGQCVLTSDGAPACLCNTGFTASGLVCGATAGPVEAGADVPQTIPPDASSACTGITCGGNGQCVLKTDGTAACLCNAGFTASGLVCVSTGSPDASTACSGATCAGNGQGLLAYYPLNNNANDESGNGNNGTVYGAAPTTDRLGVPNAAYSFDGASAYIQTPVRYNSTTYSLTAWVNRAPNNTGAILGNDNNSYEGGSLFVNPDGTMYIHNCHADTCNDVLSTGAIPAGEWHFIAVVVNSGTATFYIDGVSAGQGGPVQGYGIEWSIGRGWPDRGYFAGAIDEVRIYSVAISDVRGAGGSGGATDAGVAPDASGPADAPPDARAINPGPNLAVCQGRAVSAVSSSFTRGDSTSSGGVDAGILLDAEVIGVVKTLATQKGYVVQDGAGFITYSTSFQDTVYVEQSGSLIITSACKLDSIGQIKRFEGEMLELIGFIETAAPASKKSDLAGILCSASFKVYSDGPVKYFRSYFPWDGSGGGFPGYLSIPTGTVENDYVNACGYNNSTSISYQISVDGAQIINANNPGGTAGTPFVNYASLPPLTAGMHSVLMEGYSAGCFIGCDYTLWFYASAVIDNASQQMVMTNGATSEIGDVTATLPITDLEIPQ